MIRIITFRLLCLDTCLLGLFFCTSFQTTFQCSKIIRITLFFLIFNCLCEDLRERWAPARSGSNSSSLLMRQSPPTSCLQVWSQIQSSSSHLSQVTKVTTSTPVVCPKRENFTAFILKILNLCSVDRCFPSYSFFSLWQGESSSEMYVYLQSKKSSLHPACTLIGTAYQ